MSAIAGSDKILDSDLATFATAGKDTTRSVIVEVEVPGAAGARRAPAKKLVKRPTAKSTGTDRYATAAAKSMAKFEALLASLGVLGGAVKLPSAASFVLDVGPAELRALSQSPLVAAIRPNRVHRVGAIK